MAKRVPRELREALRAAGSAAAVARQIGVSASTVRRWKDRGVPQDRLGQLRALVEIHAALPKPKRAERPVELLRRALKKGTMAALATELGVSESTVRRWRKTGKPSAAGVERLARFLEAQKAYEGTRQEEEQRLFMLLGVYENKLEALKQAAEVATGEQKAYLEREIARISFKTGEGPRHGPQTHGYRYDKRWGRELTEFFITRFDAWVGSLKVRYRYWQGIVRMLHFDPKDEGKEFKRSGPNVVIQLGEKVNDFLVDATLTTSRMGSRAKLQGELRGMLEDVLKQGFYAYIVGATVLNYRLRTEEERKAWVRGKPLRRRLEKKRRPKKPKSPKPPVRQPKLLPPRR